MRVVTFDSALNPLEVVDFTTQGLWQGQVHTSHPRYFGLFNPAPTAMGIAADTLVAAFNSQLAAWSHAPFAGEIEQHLVRSFAEKFGYDPGQADGTFASGGAEANHTAVLAALVHGFPDFDRKGLRGLPAQPTLYLSEQGHHSLLKAARFCGLGTDAVRTIPVDGNFQMDVAALASRIQIDRSEGYAPFMVIATAGTTTAGIVEPLADIADIARKEGLWFHVDAAWGGAAMLVPELRVLLKGIERADSITFDAHKQLSVPMGAGMFLTRHKDILNRTCHMTTHYMPPDITGFEIIDPYVHSLQWSRRFIGLKVFLSLAVAGWDGYARTLRHQADMGELLRQKLTASSWQLVTTTKLPVVCFVDTQSPNGRSPAYLEAVAAEVVESGKAWISTTRLDEATFALRACVTNYRTEADDVSALVQALEEARMRTRKVVRV